jgi:energy-coupling factor transporter ATP-binding protein EcfA2
MGEKIRVALSIVLFSDASCILLDEPLSNLDPEMRQAIPEFVAEYTAGKTLLIVSHQENIWRAIVDRVIPIERINKAYKY